MTAQNKNVYGFVWAGVVQFCNNRWWSARADHGLLVVVAEETAPGSRRMSSARSDCRTTESGSVCARLIRSLIAMGVNQLKVVPRADDAGVL